MLPLVEPLPNSLAPTDVFARLAAQPHCLFLDSAREDPELGRYSFLACDPFEFLTCRPDQGDALAKLGNRLAAYMAEPVDGLPPFQGGAAGLFSYDLGRQLETLPVPRWDEFDLPILAVGLYDVVVAYDHGRQQGWIVSQGFPEQEPPRRERRARERLDQLQQLLAGPATQGSSAARAEPLPAPLSAGDLAPRFAVSALVGLTSNFSRDAYLRAIEQAIEYVHAGDIFQVNLAQRLLLPARDDAVALYLRLRVRNPAPFAGYFDGGSFQLASASPERFLRVDRGQVETRPIKGTRHRAGLPEADLFSGAELQASEKDRAENVMIVDLLRNDLSKVCLPESVRVTDLCRVENYQYVQHLVSGVVGQLAPGRTALDLLRAAFPGGSITGAPKPRAMEIIAELEPTARGAYCGSLGYLGFDGSADTSILIRTVTAARGWWQAPVGGGIIADSIPAREYEETWHKAEGLLRAF